MDGLMDEAALRIAQGSDLPPDLLGVDARPATANFYHRAEQTDAENTHVRLGDLIRLRLDGRLTAIEDLASGAAYGGSRPPQQFPLDVAKLGSLQVDMTSTGVQCHGTCRCGALPFVLAVISDAPSVQGSFVCPACGWFLVRLSADGQVEVMP